MINSLPPGLILILGALLIPILPGKLKRGAMLLLPILGFAQLCLFTPGTELRAEMFGLGLTVFRVDRLSLIFGYIFHIAAFLSVLYALGVRDDAQHVAGLMYAGSAIGAAFAGDLITLFVYWEMTAFTSVFLIWARRTERAYRVGIRYLVIQVGSGVLLLSGVILRYAQGGSLEFGHLGLTGTASMLIFLAFGIKCAFPFLHNWLQDAYPEATVTGTVFLSAFTTKLAVYALARGFAGTHCLIYIGAAMTVFPIFYAVIENDLRRVLAYSLNNQLGFMVCGIGIGTELALNGTAAHAFAHIIYKGLLFMAMGAVLHRAGTIKASELGGLYKSMPLTTAFCIVGSVSICAFPLFSGFVSKSLILSAAGQAHLVLIYFVLVFASAGVMDHSGIKIPFFAFFAHDQGIRCKEAPKNMLLAMGLAAALCIGIGVFPGPLYRLLPYSVDYNAYTTTHVVTQLQLLLGATLAFAFLFRTGLYPPELPRLNLDFDWIYRRLIPSGLIPVVQGVSRTRSYLADRAVHHVTRTIQVLHRYHGPEGVLARTWPTGRMVMGVALLLWAVLVLYYLNG